MQIMILLKSLVKTSSWLVFSLLLLACNSDDSTNLSALSNKPSESERANSASVSNRPSTTASSAQNTQVVQYKVLDNPLPSSTGDNIEVIELFWYGCSHCFALEPQIKSWMQEKPENAEFVKVPAVFSASWAFHAQAYYTMEALGVLEQANDAFFHQIHVLRKPMNDEESLVAFLADHGKTEEEVISAFNSFAVDTKLRNATNLTRQSTATGVPAILVDGKYLTSVSQAGGPTELFNVINELVEKAGNER